MHAAESPARGEEFRLHRMLRDMGVLTGAEVRDLRATPHIIFTPRRAAGGR
jgi:Fe2+ transport system protein FeoA